MATFEFHFDFGSPNSYLAHRVIPEIAARQGVSITYVPVLLGGLFKATGNQPPMMAFGNVKSKMAYQQLETERFIKAHGIKNYAFNPNFPVNTLSIMRGAVAAQREGVFDAYVEAVFQAMWEDGKKMDDPDVILAALNEAGLDGAKLMELSQKPDVKKELADNTEASVARGNFGSPTFYAKDGSRDEMFFGKDKLRDFEDMIVEIKGA